MNLILEDNRDKVTLIAERYNLHDYVLVSGETSACEALGAHFHRDVANKATIFLDYELSPGCGDGLSFLKTIIDGKFSRQIETVVVTTGSPRAAREMIAMCRDAGIETDVLRWG